MTTTIINELKKKIQSLIVSTEKDESTRMELLNKTINITNQEDLLPFISLLETKEGYDLTNITKLINELFNNDAYAISDIKSKTIPQYIIDGLLLKTKSRYNNTDSIATTTFDEIKDFEILKKIISEVHGLTENHQLMFFVPPTHEIKGRIVQRLGDTRKSVELITQVIKKDADKTGIYAPQVFFMGDYIDKRVWRPTGKKLNYNCFIYDFITDNNERLLLLFHEKLDPQDYVMKGIKVNVKDFYLVGDSKKINVTLPLFIPHSSYIKDFNVKFNDYEFNLFTKRVGFDNIISYVFRKYRHPSWFEDFVLASLFSFEYDGYPLNVLMVGKGETGKSTLLENFERCYAEPIPIISGTQSTFKALIPSFGTNPPTVGGFCIAKRISLVDEFLRLIARNANYNNDSVVSALGSMNTLLEHKKRLSMSGKGNIAVNPTARAWFATNPVYKGSDMVSLIDKLAGDIPFVSRFLVYFQTKQHSDYIDDNKNKLLFKRVENSVITINEWLGFIDYITSKQVVGLGVVDKLRVVYDEIFNSLPSSLKDVFRSRHLHHLTCLLDGLVKVRCLRSGKANFSVEQEDIDYVKEIMFTIVNSWSPDGLVGLPHKTQLEYVSYKGRIVFDLIKSQKGLLDSEISSGLFDDITQVRRYLGELKHLDLIFFDEKRSKWYPYDMKDFILNLGGGD